MATLSSWQPAGGSGAGLQPGDIGWMLRFGPDHAASRLVEGVDDDGITRLILIMESDEDWWMAIEPGSLADSGLAATFADWIERERPTGSLAIDGPAVPAAWRQVLAVRGFDGGDDPWAQLWMPLAGVAWPDVDGVVSTEDPANIADRVAVQRLAFERSTFTLDRWHEMSRHAGFDPRFDLVARDRDGTPVAAATFWFDGSGRCARLEPMGTHPDHRRRGHGRRLIAAAASLLSQAGASGISVTTPLSNEAAVGLYRAAGFRLLDVSYALVRPG
jgi:GNAT superfamily N-acetyltransferase